MLLLLRHGQTGDNASGRVRSRTATLNPQGQQAAESAAQASVGLPIKAIVTSPLPRAKETASRWAKHTGAPVVVEPRVRAREMGALEGKPISAVKGTLNKLAAHPDMAPPGHGESVKAFVHGRFFPAVKGLIHSKDLYGLVTHGSGVKAIELGLSGKPLTEWQSEPTIAPGQFALVTKDGVVPLRHDGLSMDHGHAPQGAGHEAPASS